MNAQPFLDIIDYYFPVLEPCFQNEDVHFICDQMERVFFFEHCVNTVIHKLGITANYSIPELRYTCRDNRFRIINKPTVGFKFRRYESELKSRLKYYVRGQLKKYATVKFICNAAHTDYATKWTTVHSNPYYPPTYVFSYLELFLPIWLTEIFPTTFFSRGEMMSIHPLFLNFGSMFRFHSL